MTVRKRIEVEGIVQGVGFRPFVFNLAESLGLAGFVLNHTRGVSIEVEGDGGAVRQFAERLTGQAPPLAHIISAAEMDMEPLGDAKFVIKKSGKGGDKSALITPDSDVCPDCLAEMLDPADRRYRYPFINCVNCGPRFTIVTGVPYDRPCTTMNRFEMCPACRAEYENPADRRFHAQPIACPACGPSLSIMDENFEPISPANPLAEAARLLRNGMIVAVKGIGGYHLAVDATNEEAVMRLRRRKHRDEKPFAVMFPDQETMQEFAAPTEGELALVASKPHPITLVAKKDAAALPGIAPGNRFLGAMLPYTPLHHLLFREGAFRALVMTSANVSDDPIVFTEDEAAVTLSGIADAYLVHDRPIHTRADDSIERPMAHGPVILRRARGYTPIPVLLDREYPTTLGVGGELKNTFCLIKGDRAFISQHIGDLKHDTVYSSFADLVERFKELAGVDRVEAVAHDLHPDYLSTAYAKDIGGALTGVQHHHAHMASLMAELHIVEDCIGVIFDGTGYGEDGTIWGGEFLVGGLSGYERAGNVRPVALPGGEAAIREPYRIALGILFELYGDDIPDLGLGWLGRLDFGRRALIRQMVDKKVNTPMSHGVGRLFDAASALLGIRHTITFEGQAAMELEMAIENGDDGVYPVDTHDMDGKIMLDFTPAFAAMTEQKIAAVTAPVLAARFHNTVAAGALAVVEKISERTGHNSVLLSGGVFQNRYLSDRLGSMLEAKGFMVGRHGRVPPNDGGISLGQAVLAATRLVNNAI